MHREPTMVQAAYYSATTTYLNAVKQVNSTDPEKVMDALHSTTIKDMFTDAGKIRADGLNIPHSGMPEVILGNHTV